MRSLAYRLELGSKLSKTHEKYIRQAQSYVAVINSIVARAKANQDVEWLDQLEPFPTTPQFYKLFAIHMVTMRPGSKDPTTGIRRVGCMMESMAQYQTSIRFVNSDPVSYTHLTLPTN